MSPTLQITAVFASDFDNRITTIANPNRLNGYVFTASSLSGIIPEYLITIVQSFDLFSIHFASPVGELPYDSQYAKLRHKPCPHPFYAIQDCGYWLPIDSTTLDRYEGLQLPPN